MNTISRFFHSLLFARFSHSRWIALGMMLVLALSATAKPATAQTTLPQGEWAWMGGSETGDQSGVYGTRGIPAAGNTPGARESAVNWTDKSGNFWLFGGGGSGADGFGGTLNDLWEYNPSTKLWAWMSGSDTGGQPGVYGTLGVPAAGNTPGARIGAISWTDKNGNFWLFGSGFDGSYGDRNDLWEYNPSTNLWAWMGGSNTYDQPGVYGTLGVPAAGNTPGARDSAVTWTDTEGNLWLFGGEGVDANSNVGYLNDIWEFNPSTNEWAWMGGSDIVPSCSFAPCGLPGVYGTLGVPDAASIPGSRMDVVSWTDKNDNLWLFGGYGIWGYLNDLWEYNPSTKLWAWMGGSDTVGQPGVYGTLGVLAAENIPGARNSSASWTDKSGTLWLFGGDYGGVNAVPGHYFNDLWEYNPSTNLWAWMGGSKTTDQPGVYGTLGTPAAANIPGGRAYAVSWTDKNGNLWLFGGSGVSGDYLNDLWEYTPDAYPALLTAPAPGTNLTGTTATFDWTQGSNVTAYEFRLGTKYFGSSDLALFESSTALSYTATNLPAAGKSIYARLYSKINGAWQYNDYLFAANAVPAVLTTPTPGTTLFNTSITFNWTKGSAVTEYVLWLSTAAGHANLGDFTTGSALTYTATNLNGTTVYVRLWSKIAGVWHFNNFTYTTAFPETPAALTTPTSGSTLTGSTVTFDWTAGSDVSAYELRLGTKGAGSSDLALDETTHGKDSCWIVTLRPELFGGYFLRVAAF